MRKSWKFLGILPAVLAVLVMLVAIVPTAPVAAATVEKLYLVKKDPATWQEVSGAHGLLYFHPVGSKFTYSFAARGLQPNTAYALIYYADGWPGNNPGGLIGVAKADASGLIMGMKGSIELNTDIPAPTDANYPAGGKIWLVLASDYNPATRAMVAWNPTSYLFERYFIKYVDVP